MKINAMIDWLKGKRTYAVAIVGGVYAALIGLGAVPNYDFVWGLLGTGGLAFLRAGVSDRAAR